MNIDNIINNTAENELEAKLASLYINKDFSNLFSFLMQDELNFINFLNKTQNEDLAELKRNISFENMKYFICSDKEEIKEIAFDYFKNTNNTIAGTLNVETNTVELENKAINKILNEQQLLVDQNLLDSIDICSEFNMKNLPIEIELNDKIELSLKKESNFISNTILASSLFLSFSCFADEMGDAQRHTFRALKEVKEVQEVVNEKKTNIEFKANRIYSIYIIGNPPNIEFLQSVDGNTYACL